MRLVLLLIMPVAFAQTWVLQPSGSIASLRGVSVVNGQEAWASGSGGTFLRTTDSGKTWKAGVVPGAGELDFRGVQALSADAAFLMASGEGKKSGVFQTGDGGSTWRTFYANPDEKGFFDAIAMPAMRDGMLFGDPVDGVFALFRINQEGAVFSHVKRPAAMPGEGGFAASNTALVMRGHRVWFATGGKSGSRVFRSDDAGEHWTVAQTPVRSGADGAGIFSLAFADSRNGIAVGGDYSRPSEDAHNIAITADGGITWSEPAGTRPRGYRSAVAWLPEHRMWITTGPTGSEVSSDGGRNWKPIDDGAFNAIGVGPGDACWAVGAKGRIARLGFEKK